MADNSIRPDIISTEENKKVKHEKRLPVFLLSNIQSFGKTERTDKTIETEEILKMNFVDVAVFTETWLNKETADRLPFKEYQKFHLIRSNVARSSGGVSIFVKNCLPAAKLKIKVPDNLECIWVTIRPNWLPRAVSNIIVCGVYYPGSGSLYSPEQENLIFHIITAVEFFRREYENPLFLIMGDFNDLPIKSICTACDFKQAVKVPTRGNAILDLVLTNRKNKLYQNPISLPKIGDGDHFPVLFGPRKYNPPANTKQVKKIRKFPESALQRFGSWITTFDWSEMDDIPHPNDKVIYFNTITRVMVDHFFPLQNVVTSSTDKEWVTPEIKAPIRKRQKAHMQNNLELRDSFYKKIKLEVKQAKIAFYESKKEFFRNNNPKEWYKHINNIINNGNSSQLNLTNIPELANKLPTEQIKIIKEQFNSIC